MKVGKRSVRVDFRGLGGLSLRRTTAVPVFATSTLRLWAFSPVPVSLVLSVQSEDSNPVSGAQEVSLPGKVWKELIVMRAQLGSPNRVKRLNVQLNSDRPTTLLLRSDPDHEIEAGQRRRTKPVAQATWLQRHSGAWLTD